MAKVILKLDPWQAQLVLAELARRLGEEERDTVWRRVYRDRLLVTMMAVANQIAPTEVVVEGPLHRELYLALVRVSRVGLRFYNAGMALAYRLVKRQPK